MKITRRQLRQIIKEAILLEEPSDYLKDLRSGSITRAQYDQLVRDFERRQKGLGTGRDYGASSDDDDDLYTYTPPPRPKPIWKGTKQELTKRVHKYLIDIGFYLDGGGGYVNPFSQGNHPDGGYTSSIPKVIKAGIASGDIDWATWPEIEPVYNAIDRSID